MDGNSFHIKAEEAREKGEFLEALKLTDEATLAYQKEGNIVKLAETQASRALTLRHLFEQTDDKSFLILAKHAAKSGVKIAEESGGQNGKAIPLYTLAKCYESLEKLDKAKESIEEAIQAVEDDEQNRPAVVAEMRTRLAAIKYSLGENSLSEFEQALSDLEQAEEDSYNKNVWLSGAHMHMAEAFISRGEKDKAVEHISKAKTIIDSDERLSLRRGQLTKLYQKLV